MVLHESDIERSVRKGAIAEDVFRRSNNAFMAMDVTRDLGLFDVKKLRSSERRTYYRLRKGKYRAIFYVENRNYYVVSIAKREEVYRQWE